MEGSVDSCAGKAGGKVGTYNVDGDGGIAVICVTTLVAMYGL